MLIFNLIEDCCKNPDKWEYHWDANWDCPVFESRRTVIKIMERGVYILNTGKLLPIPKVCVPAIINMFGASREEAIRAAGFKDNELIRQAYDKHMGYVDE